MQIFECLKNKVNAQNLVEFVFVLPILIFMTLCIFELALFWQDVNTIYSLNTEINANAALVDTKSLVLGSHCPAAIFAKNIMEAKAPIVSMTKPTFTINMAGADYGSTEPFVLYKITSDTMVNGVNPLATVWVDCRNPFENGITTQIEFFHKTLIMQASIPRFDGEKAIEILPKNIYIASSKLNTIKHY